MPPVIVDETPESLLRLVLAVLWDAAFSVKKAHAIKIHDTPTWAVLMQLFVMTFQTHTWLVRLV